MSLRIGSSRYPRWEKGIHPPCRRQLTNFRYRHSRPYSCIQICVKASCRKRYWEGSSLTRNYRLHHSQANPETETDIDDPDILWNVAGMAMYSTISFQGKPSLLQRKILRSTATGCQVAGYSAFFTTLAPDTQDDIIARTEQSL